MVKMKNLLTENSWLWERGKFMNRRYLMQVDNIILNLTSQFQIDIGATILLIRKNRNNFHIFP